jgi:hypothetical protein
MDEKFEEASRALVAGEIGFTQFAKTTHGTRQRWVRGMRRKLGPIPAWHADEDSEQDFLLAIYENREVPDGYPPGTYFRLGMRKVDKKIQKARGVEQHRRVGKAVFELPFSSLIRANDLGEELEPAWLALPVPETQERDIARTEYYAVLKQLCTTQMQRAAVLAMEETNGSLSAAAAYMFADTGSCLVCRLDSEEHAARIILRVVDELIETYGEEKEARKS